MFIGNKKCRIYAACGVSQTPNFYMYSEDDENAQNVGIYKIEIALESEVAEDNFIWDNPPNGIFVGGQN